MAPVNAPFSWPKSWLSRRVSLSADELNATKGAAARRDELWMARASMVLPVPVSPEDQDRQVGAGGDAGEAEARRHRLVVALEVVERVAPVGVTGPVEQ